MKEKPSRGSLPLVFYSARFEEFFDFGRILSQINQGQNNKPGPGACVVETVYAFPADKDSSNPLGLGHWCTHVRKKAKEFDDRVDSLRRSQVGIGCEIVL